jgi:hypothetical protein
MLTAWELLSVMWPSMQYTLTETGWTCVDEPLGVGARVLFSLFGLLPLIAPYSMWPALFPFTLFGILAWTVSIGAVAISVIVIGSVLFSPAYSWRTEKDQVVIEKRSMFGATQRNIPASDIQDIQVQTQRWTDGANSFCLRFETKLGTFMTPSYDDQNMINTLAVRSRTLFGLAPLVPADAHSATAS